jgi:hypothetical protein
MQQWHTVYPEPTLLRASRCVTSQPTQHELTDTDDPKLDRKTSGRGEEASGRWVAYVPYEGGTSGRLRGIQSVCESSPEARSQPFPARAVSPPAAVRSRSPICAAHYGRHVPSVGPSQ